jgi:hypothetical protein
MGFLLLKNSVMGKGEGRERHKKRELVPQEKERSRESSGDL